MCGHTFFFFLTMGLIYGIFYYLSYINHIYKASSVNSVSISLKQKCIEIMNGRLFVSSPACKELGSRSSALTSEKLDTLKTTPLLGSIREVRPWGRRRGQMGTRRIYRDGKYGKMRAESLAYRSCPFPVQRTLLFLQCIPFPRRSMFIFREILFLLLHSNLSHLRHV